MMSSEQVDKIFDKRDYYIMKWAFCRYMCQEGDQLYADYQLFLNSGVKGVMGDQKLLREYVLENDDNIYREFVRRVLECLITKGLLRAVRKISEPDGEKIEYEMTEKLKDHCKYFKKYMMGNVDDIDTGFVNPL